MKAMMLNKFYTLSYVGASMPRQPEDAKIVTLERLLQTPVLIADYQREVSWNFKKMVHLWRDMFLHAQRFESDYQNDPFFIGALILNHNPEPLAIDIEVVDGQQRLTTITIISAAIRDALISTGHTDKAWDIHSKILRSYDGAGSQERFVPQHIVPAAGYQGLSSRTMLQPYQELICPVDSGLMLTQDAHIGDDEICIDAATHMIWTYLASEIVIFRNNKKIGTLELVGPTQFLKGQSLPSHTISLRNNLGICLLKDDQIWINHKSKWTSGTGNINTYHADNHHFYSSDFRNLYLLVRRECEHFIVEDHVKNYKTVEIIDKDSTTVELVCLNQHLLSLPGQHPKSNLELPRGLHSTHVDLENEDKKKWKQGTKSHLKDRLVLKGKTRRPLRGAQTIPLGTEISVKYVPKVDIQGFQNNPENRAENLNKLISDMCVIEVQFNTGKNIAKPVGHFLNTNDKSKMAPLETLDMLNALVNIVKNNPYGLPPPPRWQDVPATGIEEKWMTDDNSIWKTLYLNQKKNPAHAKDFFYQWMIASKRWKGKNDRWTAEETFEGIQEYWYGQTKLVPRAGPPLRNDKIHLRKSDGEYDLEFLEPEFEEMQIYAIIYESSVLNHQNAADGTTLLNKHKQYLRIAKTIGHQWVPPYLAIRYLGQKHGYDNNDILDIAGGFLKEIITLYLKYSAYPRIVRNNDGRKISTMYQPNEMYGYILGTEPNKWITKIHATLDGTALTPNRKNSIKRLPRQVVDGKQVIEWIKSTDISAKAIVAVNNSITSPLNAGLTDRELAKEANKKYDEFLLKICDDPINDPNRKKCYHSLIQGNGADIPTFMFAYESVIAGNGDTASDWHVAEIEHVLPKRPRTWGAHWWTPKAGIVQGHSTEAHRRCVEKLGNKAHINNTRNKHIGNKSWEFKNSPPLNPDLPCTGAGCGDHYDNADFSSIRGTGNKASVNSYGTWDEDIINSRTIKMIDLIIGHFNF